MEHYTKGRNEEEELNSANIPLTGIPQGHGWMLITGRTRLQTAIGPACTLIKEEGTLVMAGVGNSAQKVETLAGMVKKRIKGLFQVNKVGKRIVREYWDPKSEDLDHLVVTRVQPTLHILLSVNRIECGDEEVICPTLKVKEGKTRKKKDLKGIKDRQPQSEGVCNVDEEGRGVGKPRRGKTQENQSNMGRIGESCSNVVQVKGSEGGKKMTVPL